MTRALGAGSLETAGVWLVADTLGFVCVWLSVGPDVGEEAGEEAGEAVFPVTTSCVRVIVSG